MCQPMSCLRHFYNLLHKYMLVTYLKPYVSPTKFFSSQQTEKVPWRNVMFAVLTLMSVPLVRIGLGNLVGIFCEKYFAPYTVIFAFSLWQTPVEVILQQVMLVPLYVFSLFWVAIFLHSLLWMARGKNASYAATLRCVCYTAPCLYLSVFPYSGTLTAVIYSSIFLGYSLKAMHCTEWRKVLPVVAMFFPVLFIMCNMLFP